MYNGKLFLTFGFTICDELSVNAALRIETLQN